MKGKLRRDRPEVYKRTITIERVLTNWQRVMMQSGLQYYWRGGEGTAVGGKEEE